MDGQQAAGSASGATPGTPATGGHAAQVGTPGAATAASGAGATPASSATSAATGEEALGDTGAALLKEERRKAREAEARATAAEARAAELETGQQTETERSIAAAKREAAAEERAKWSERARKAEVRGALRGAGIVDDAALDLALGSPTFASLKVDNDSGNVEGVTEAVEEFKTKHAYLFGKAATAEDPKTGAGNGAAAGSWGGSEGGSNDTPVAPGMSRLRRGYSESSTRT